MNDSAQPTLVIADAVRVWGGAQRFVLDAALGLRARGWRVVLVVYPDAPLHRRAVAAGLSVRPTRTRANGAPWTVLPLRTWFRSIGADILLTTYDKDLRTAGLAARLAGAGPRGPIAVIHSRECDTPIKDRPHIRWFHRHVADRIWVNSEATLRTTLRGSPWLAAEKLERMPKGIDIERFTPVEGEAGTGVCTFGFAGQLVPRKQLPTVLEALATLPRASFRLKIAGEGPEGTVWRQRASELGLADRVEWCGFVEDMPRFHRDVDVFLQPSREEGWGYVVAEACASGKLVVALGRSSNAEVLGDAGWVLPDADASTWARALRRALELDVEERREWGRRARRRAERELSLDTMLDRMEDGLRRCLDLRRPPSPEPPSEPRRKS